MRFKADSEYAHITGGGITFLPYVGLGLQPLQLTAPELQVVALPYAMPSPKQAR